MSTPQPEPEANPLAPYDAILLLSFGGPEQPDDVMPFLRNVTAGRGIPDERLAAVAEHYYAFGGRSPINDQNRALLAALRAELDRRGIGTPLLWGNRNFDPFVTDALREAHEGGVRRVLTVVTSAYSSYSSCRQYREDLAAGGRRPGRRGARAGRWTRCGPTGTTPGSPGPTAAWSTEAARALGAVPDAQARLVFVTHSIPDGDGRHVRPRRR